MLITPSEVQSTASAKHFSDHLRINKTKMLRWLTPWWVYTKNTYRRSCVYMPHALHNSTNSLFYYYLAFFFYYYAKCFNFNHSNDQLADGILANHHMINNNNTHKHIQCNVTGNKLLTNHLKHNHIANFNFIIIIPSRFLYIRLYSDIYMRVLAVRVSVTKTLFACSIYMYIVLHLWLVIVVFIKLYIMNETYWAIALSFVQ